MIYKVLLVAITMLISNYSFSETCKLKGVKLSKHAHKNGFSFTSAATGEAYCQMSSHKAGGSAARGESGGCTFKLFSGKELSSPWVFSDINYSGKKFTIIKFPKSGDNNLSLEVLLTPDNNGTAKFLVSHIEIEGGDCDKWKSAF